MADSMQSVDVVVVGAGMSGLCSAYQLLRRRPKSKIVILEAKGQYSVL